jgi:hypothetical protein
LVRNGQVEANILSEVFLNFGEEFSSSRSFEDKEGELECWTRSLNDALHLYEEKS